MGDLFEFDDVDQQLSELSRDLAPSKLAPTDSTAGSQPTDHAAGSQPTAPRKRAQPSATPARNRKRQAVQTAATGFLRVLNVAEPQRLTCVFATATNAPEQGKRAACKVVAPIAVALWPQYKLTLAHPEFVDTTWLAIGFQEQWLRQLVHAMKAPTESDKGERGLVTAVRQLWLPRFREALQKRRNEIGQAEPAEEDAEDEAGCDVADDPREKIDAARLTFRKVASVDITVMGHTLTMLNVLRPCILNVDDALCTFIQTHVASSVRALAPSQQMQNPIIQPLAPFHFVALEMPNVRGKVTWVPDQHAWRLDITKPKEKLQPGQDLTGQTLAVAPSLSPEKYTAAKRDAYTRAIHTWNAVDGSTRLRIWVGPSGAEVPSPEPLAPSQLSQAPSQQLRPSQPNAAGSQPTVARFVF